MPFYRHVGFMKWAGISSLGCFKGDLKDDIVDAIIRNSLCKSVSIYDCDTPRDLSIVTPPSGFPTADKNSSSEIHWVRFVFQ